MTLALTRCQVFPGGGQGGVWVGTMGLMRWTIMLVMAMQQLPVRPLFQVVCKRHLIDGPMGTHHSLCAAQDVNQ